MTILEQVKARLENAANDLVNELKAAGVEGVSVKVKGIAKGLSVVVKITPPSPPVNEGEQVEGFKMETPDDLFNVLLGGEGLTEFLEEAADLIVNEDGSDMSGDGSGDDVPDYVTDFEDELNIGDDDG